ncbi:MAG: zinc ribbon domain-containing protein [Anaerolineales bacterium]
MSASLGLFRLQKVDSRISQIQMRLSKIRETLENDVEVRVAMEQVKATEAEQRDSTQSLRNIESKSQDQQIKIQQAEASLYGGSIHNPKELQDLQADIASLKKQLPVLEEHQLEAMLKVEDSQSALQKKQQALQKIQTEKSGEHKIFIYEQNMLMRDLESLQSERQAVVSSMATEILNVYEDLRQQRRGVAVAEIADNTCGACGTTLTAALQQNVRYTAELMHCPSCGRILYAA